MKSLLEYNCFNLTNTGLQTETQTLAEIQPTETQK